MQCKLFQLPVNIFTLLNANRELDKPNFTFNVKQFIEDLSSLTFFALLDCLWVLTTDNDWPRLPVPTTRNWRLSTAFQSKYTARQQCRNIDARNNVDDEDASPNQNTAPGQCKWRRKECFTPLWNTTTTKVENRKRYDSERHAWQHRPTKWEYQLRSYAQQQRISKIHAGMDAGNGYDEWNVDTEWNYSAEHRLNKRRSDKRPQMLALHKLFINTINARSPQVEDQRRENTLNEKFDDRHTSKQNSFQKNQK